MALVLKDRVKETNSATGTSNFALTGAVAGFRSFADIGNANTTYYLAHDTTANTWEAGIGTYTASGTTLSRDTVLNNSSGGTSKISFANAPVVWCDVPAAKLVTLDASGDTKFAGGGTIIRSGGGIVVGDGDYIGGGGAAGVGGLDLYGSENDDATKRVRICNGLLDISASAAGQIKFPATQNASSNANTLDDYERGTWSGGGLTFGGGSTGMSVSIGGSYVKNGRAVVSTLDFVLTTKGSSTGTALFTNALPFTPASSYGVGVTPPNLYALTLTGVLALNQWNSPGTKTLDIMALSNGAQTVLTDAAFASGCQFYCVIPYIAAA